MLLEKDGQTKGFQLAFVLQIYITYLFQWVSVEMFKVGTPFETLLYIPWVVPPPSNSENEGL